jgi:hypothetical protein
MGSSSARSWYYRRFGFRPAGALGLRRPSTRIPADAFRAIALPPHESWMTGTVVCAEPFWALDRVGAALAAGDDEAGRADRRHVV